MALIGSTALVLLDVSRWLPVIPALDFDPSETLRDLVLLEHRRLRRQLTDLRNPALRINGQPLLSLDKPVSILEGGEEMSLAELLPDRAAIDPGEAYVEISDPRVLEVWSKFTDRERVILKVKAQPGVTWASAAVECGGSPAEGERLARRCWYLRRTGALPDGRPSSATG